MQLGNFSVSLNVKSITKSKAFYEALGFTMIAGEEKQGWTVMNNGVVSIGLFHGMFKKNILTFNPGWDSNGETLKTFTDVRDIQKKVKASGIKLEQEAKEGSEPTSFSIIDPDGNPILIDQHVPRPKKN